MKFITWSIIISLHNKPITADLSAMNSKLNRLIAKYKYSKSLTNDPFYTTDPKGVNRHNQQKAQQKFNNWISSWQLATSQRSNRDFKKVASLEYLGDYGCWCNFQKESTWSPNSVIGASIKHKSINQIDNLCKQLHNNYDCLKLQDHCNLGLDEIEVSQMSYILDDQGLLAETFSEIEYSCGTWTTNSCQRNLCISESTFVVGLLKNFLNKQPIDKDFRHAMFGFNLKKECSVAKHSDEAFSQEKVRQNMEKSIFQMAKGSPVESSLSSYSTEETKILNIDDLTEEDQLLTSASSNNAKNPLSLLLTKKKGEKDDKSSELALQKYLLENFTCCGLYPNKFPYKKDGVKECCRDQLYSGISQCCEVTEGFVAPIGTCM